MTTCTKHCYDHLTDGLCSRHGIQWVPCLGTDTRIPTLPRPCRTLVRPGASGYCVVHCNPRTRATIPPRVVANDLGKPIRRVG